MPPEDADFSVVIDFEKGAGNPRRVFDAASLLIEGFERLDRTAIESIDSKIEPLLVLEDVDKGSLRIWLKNTLRKVDDGALRDLEWKKQVGKYLVKAKYVALEWLDKKDAKPPSLQALSNDLRQIAQETDVRRLPDYAPVHDAKLLGALDKIQDAKKQLTPGDKLFIDTEEKRYEVDISSTWSPTAEIAPDSKRETTSHGEMILSVRKPDMIGHTKWQFRHGPNNISAPINDEKWVADYLNRQVDIRPGDALRCWVKFTYVYAPDGTLSDQTIEIEKVFEVIQGHGPQASFFDD